MFLGPLRFDMVHVRAQRHAALRHAALRHSDPEHGACVMSGQRVRFYALHGTAQHGAALALYLIHGTLG